MVPENSPGIPRVPGYSGAGLAIRAGFRVRGSHPLRRRFPAASAILPGRRRRPVLLPRTGQQTRAVWAPPLSLATTHGIIVIFFSCGYLDVSVPRVRLPYMACHTQSVAGSPIRTSAPQRACAPQRGFSQLVTSFFASESQGIRHVPFSVFRLSFTRPGYILRRELLRALFILPFLSFPSCQCPSRGE